MDNKLPYTFQVDAYWAAEPDEINNFAQSIVACAEGHLSPLAAARKITDELASEAWRNKAHIDLHHEDRPYRTHTVLVAVLIGSCASAFPPSSVVHDRLLKMIKSFLKVEQRQIPNVLIDATEKAESAVDEPAELSPFALLWESLQPLSLASSWSWLSEIGESWSGAEKCGSQEQQRWRNLSYFSAKVAIEGIDRLGRQSPLQNLLPKYHALDQDTVGWSGYLAGQTLAAAQWFVPKSHASWVWRACCLCEKHSLSKASLSSQEKDEVQTRTCDDNEADFARLEGWLWNLENWDAWKAAFAKVTEMVEDPRVHEVVRRAASEALKIMDEVEIIGEND
ncbi:hypothetical protein QM012_005492 [Aureobasidium pullulans]|uniref:Uncharacterized protein n=1 Tax=Aureobasidium pullulans TaxID=5580 RepID=A0ABR0T4V5_AURPU